jgi:hypothetical protein
MKKLIAVTLAVAMLLTLAGTVFASPKPGINFSGTHDTLNLIGKKAGWNGNGDSGNVMFVPQDTSAFATVNGQPGIQINVTQGADFQVIDSNALDGDGSFQLGPGTYNVYVVALGKPGGNASITGWIYDAATTAAYLQVGTVKVGGHNGKPYWQDATGLFYYSGYWVFDYLASLNAQNGNSNSYYFWQYDNAGDKLVQVRFYPTGG